MSKQLSQDKIKYIILDSLQYVINQFNIKGQLELEGFKVEDFGIRILVRVHGHNTVKSAVELYVAELKKRIAVLLEDHKMHLDVIFTSQSLGSKSEGKSNNSLSKLPGVKKIIAIASGKGGVGKSTITKWIASSLTKEGLNIGIVDVDIYGPSLSYMFDVKERPEYKNGQIVPIIKESIQLASIGFMMDEAGSIAWRGPMLVKALAQLISGVAWDNLDLLLIDTPPGTGDIHLSLFKQYPVSGVIVVTTPHPLAVADTKKGIDLYKKLEIPIIGVVENMSFLIDAHGNCSFPFGRGGGDDIATSYNIPILARIPLQEVSAFEFSIDTRNFLKNFVSEQWV